MLPDESSPVTRKWIVTCPSRMTSSEGLMRCSAVCCVMFVPPYRRFHSSLWQHKFQAISRSGLEHSLYVFVPRFTCRRQRHCGRRDTEFPEPSFKTGGSKQNKHPALLRFDGERMPHIAR